MRRDVAISAHRVHHQTADGAGVLRVREVGLVRLNRGGIQVVSAQLAADR